MYREISAHLLAWKSSEYRKPLILLGARQVGKTYSLKEFGKLAFRRTHYLNFEKQLDLANLFSNSLSPQKILQQLSLFLNESFQVETDLLILDEIQAVPLALTSLKYFAEELPQLAVCAAGSLLGITLREGTFPVGKVNFLHMYPLNFYEFLWASGRKDLADFLSTTPISELIISDLLHSELWHLSKIYCGVGGLPEVVQTYCRHQSDLPNAIKEVESKQDELLLTYWADISKHSGKVKALHIRRLMENIPAQLAREIEGATKRFTFKGVIPGVNRYEKLAGPIDWLEAAGLIHKCFIADQGLVPFSAYQKESRFKLYFFDVGLLARLSGLQMQSIFLADYGTFKGFFAENFVAQELIAGVVNRLFSWNEGTAEVEFMLASAKGKVIPLEVKAGQNVKAKSLSVFYAKYKPEIQIVLSGLPLKAPVKKMDGENQMSQKYFLPLYLSRRIKDLKDFQ